MKVDNIFTTIAKSKTGQKFYEKVLNPKYAKNMDRFLPICETALISSFYIASTAMQPKIDKESKQAMQIQNVLSMLFSVGLAVPLNKKASQFGEKIIENLKPDLMPKAHKVMDGIRVGLPILNSIVISRFMVAVGLVPLSSKIRDVVHQKREAKKLDVKA